MSVRVIVAEVPNSEVCCRTNSNRGLLTLVVCEATVCPRIQSLQGCGEIVPHYAASVLDLRLCEVLGQQFVVRSSEALLQSPSEDVRELRNISLVSGCAECIYERRRYIVELHALILYCCQEISGSLEYYVAARYGVDSTCAREPSAIRSYDQLGDVVTIFALSPDVQAVFRHNTGQTNSLVCAPCDGDLDPDCSAFRMVALHFLQIGWVVLVKSSLVTA
jgi:hypothetical protein